MKLFKFLSLSSLMIASAASAGNYVIGVENISYYPHYDFNQPPEKQGFARELFDSFAADSGHTFTYKSLPVSRLLDNFFDGDVDLKYPDNALWASDLRGKYDIKYSDSVVGYIDGVATKSSTTDLKVLTTVRGFSPWLFLDDIKAGKLTLREQNDVHQLIKFVLAGRADGAYSNIDIINYHLKKMGKTGELEFRSDLAYSQSAYNISTIAYPELITEFNQWLADNAEKIKALKTKYHLTH